MQLFQIAEVADWVEKRTVSSADTPDGSAPSEFLLVDYQDRVSDDRIERYCRTIERINDESRLEDVSLLLHELNDQEVLLIHYVRVIRGESVVDALAPERVTVNERQRGLESHVVDGVTTISYSIEDLRVGDTVDYAYTLVTHVGQHPVRGRYYLANRWLSWSIPVKVQFVRLVNETERPVRWYLGRSNEQKLSSEEGLVPPGERYELTLTGLPIHQIGQETPSWFWPDFLVLATEKTWSTLSAELAEKFRAMGVWEESVDLTEVLDTTSLEPEQLIVRLLRFVQNEVRYKSESNGIFSHTPKLASRTLAARHGDCKDKAALLKVLLAQIGVDSDLVLVSTEMGRKVASLPPSPSWFDHMILRIHHQGNVFYVDPTIKKQGGDLQHLSDLPYACGLPICDDGCELQRLPRHPGELVFDLTHTVDFSHADVDHYYLGIRRVFFRHRADNIRYFLSSKSPEILANDFLGYARNDLDVDLAIETPIHVEQDDLESNRLETYEQYRIDGLGRDDDNRALQIPTDHVNNFPVTTSPDYPLEHELDGVLLHKIDVKYRVAGSATQDEHRIQSDWFSYRDSVSSTKDAYCFRSETRPGKCFVSAQNLKTYLGDVEAMRKRSVNTFPYRTHPVDWMDRFGAAMGVAALIAFAIGVLINMEW